MKNKKLLCLAIMSTPLLFACGESSSSSKDDDLDDVKAGIIGTWQTPLCDMGDYYDETNSFDYKRTLLTIDESSIKTLDNTYSDSDCTLLISSSESEVTLQDDGAAVGSDTGLEMRKFTTSDSSNNKWLAYINPSANHLLVTPGSTTHPTQIDFSHHYVKQGADFSANSSGTNITVLGHFGLNLKTGIGDESAGTNDLSTTQWSPSNKYIGGESYGSGIWLRDYENANELYIYPTGETDLSKAVILPPEWLTLDPSDEADSIPSVKKGEVNIVRLHDGSYAKLKVLNTPDPDADNWPVLIEYQLLSE